MVVAACCGFVVAVVVGGRGGHGALWLAVGGRGTLW